MLLVNRRDETQANTYSTLSLKKVAKFFNTLGIGTVSESSVGRWAKILDFPPKQPVLLGEVGKIYLLITLSKIYGFTQLYTVDKFFTDATNEMINGYWTDVAHHGNIDKVTFNDRLLEFHRKNT